MLSRHYFCDKAVEHSLKLSELLYERQTKNRHLKFLRKGEVLEEGREPSASLSARVFTMSLHKS